MTQLPAIKKNNFITRLVYRFKNLFFKEKSCENPSKDLLSNFKSNIKVSVNPQIIVLKSKLEKGEIQALDLTDSQIDELQKIYDEEIRVKQHILSKLKGRVINPAFFTYKLTTSSVVISTTAANY